MRRIVDWSVRLAGAETVLEAFANVYRGPDPKVTKVDGRYYLRADEFLRYTDSLDVTNAAAPLIQRMCGLLNLYGNYVGEVWAENAVWTDANGKEGGTLTSMRILGTIVSREALPFLSEGGESPTGSRAVQYQQLAEKDPAVEALLRLVGWNTMGWGDLYMVFEILREACGGKSEFCKFAQIGEKGLSRFTETANSYRHAGLRRRSPRDAMPWHEATNWLRGIARKWLETKLQEGA